MCLLSKIVYILLSSVSECALPNIVPLMHASWCMYLSTRPDAFIHPVSNIAVSQATGRSARSHSKCQHKVVVAAARYVPLTYSAFHGGHACPVRLSVTVCQITSSQIYFFNPLKPELNPICYLLALLGAHHFLHVRRIRVKSLTLRLLMS